jgi:hypothetical protein
MLGCVSRYKDLAKSPQERTQNIMKAGLTMPGVYPIIGQTDISQSKTDISQSKTDISQYLMSLHFPVRAAASYTPIHQLVTPIAGENRIPTFFTACM